MSRPRTPFGPNPPGRLLATMVKVLAAESSDQNRLARGKRYWSDDAVIDIVVGHGAVTAEVQGNRPDPYVVTLEAAGGAGVPSRRELWIRCTCPDDTGTGSDACKHAVAALFALSDEIAIEPDLVDRWRAGSRTARPDAATPSDARADVARLPDRTRDGDEPDVHDDRNIAEVVPLRVDPGLSGVSLLLQAPAGATPVAIPDPDPIEHPGVRSELLADVLDDALDHLAIRWE